MNWCLNHLKPPYSHQIAAAQMAGRPAPSWEVRITFTPTLASAAINRSATPWVPGGEVAGTGMWCTDVPKDGNIFKDGKVKYVRYYCWIKHPLNIHITNPFTNKNVWWITVRYSCWFLSAPNRIPVNDVLVTNIEAHVWYTISHHWPIEGRPSINQPIGKGHMQYLYHPYTHGIRLLLIHMGIIWCVFLANCK